MKDESLERKGRSRKLWGSEMGKEVQRGINNGSGGKGMCEADKGGERGGLEGGGQ